MTFLTLLFSITVPAPVQAGSDYRKRWCWCIPPLPGFVCWDQSDLGTDWGQIGLSAPLVQTCLLIQSSHNQRARRRRQEAVGDRRKFHCMNRVMSDHVIVALKKWFTPLWINTHIAVLNSRLLDASSLGSKVSLIKWQQQSDHSKTKVFKTKHPVNLRVCAHWETMCL